MIEPTEGYAELDGGPEDGPLILPPGACCKDCAYSILQPVPGQVQRVRICRRFPPTPVLVPVQTARGASMTLTAQSPVVADEFYCYEFDEREEAEVIPLGPGGLLPAND